MVEELDILLALDPDAGRILRAPYASAFLNTSKKYFRGRIGDVQRSSYSGYLWDCIKDPQIIRPDDFSRELRERGNVFVMADCHPTERAGTDVAKRLLSGQMFKAVAKDLTTVLNILPEDSYFFDEKMQWTLIATHKYINDVRWCIRADCRNRSLGQ